MIRIAMVCMSLAATEAVAQDDFNVPSEAETASFQTCLDSNPERDCIGAVMRPCMETEEGMTTYGMVECTARELSLWDNLLNERYRELMSMYSANDDDDEEYAAYAANLSDHYRDAQRAWIAFRDADCNAEAARYEGGSLARVVHIGCLNSKTAHRAIWLAVQMQEG